MQEDLNNVFLFCAQAYIGPPSLQARYEILRSAVMELGRAGIIEGNGGGGGQGRRIASTRELKVLFEGQLGFCGEEGLQTMQHVWFVLGGEAEACSRNLQA